MRVFRNLDQLPAFKNAVLTIGSFDGVHRGHQHILQQIKQLARSVNGETVLVTFDPHPRITLAQQRGEKAQVRLLTTLDEKATLLEKYGIDNLVVVPFTPAFSQLSPDAYIEDFLVQKFHPKHIVIGYDHKFGKGRAGDIEYLKKFAPQYNFTVTEIHKQEVEDIAVSSTKVRKAISTGDVGHAYKLMGHFYRLSGEVVHGQQIGRILGFPTANIHVNNEYKLIPEDGIYAVLVQHNGRSYQGMLYIGNRPTVDDNLEKTIEVHIFDFDASIYEQHLKLDFIDFLRADAKFENLDELKAQLEQDQQAALAALARLQNDE